MISYLTLPLPYITQILAFDTHTDTHAFLDSHSASIYTNPTLPLPPTTTPKTAWRPIQKPKPTPVTDLVWDAKKAAGAIGKGLEKYRVVDLKGQVD